MIEPINGPVELVASSDAELEQLMSEYRYRYRKTKVAEETERREALRNPHINQALPWIRAVPEGEGGMNANETITMQFKADYADREQPTRMETTATWLYTKSDPLVIWIRVDNLLHYVIPREYLAKILGVPGAVVPAGEHVSLLTSRSGQSLILHDSAWADASIRFPAEMVEEFYYATTEIVVPGEETPAIWAAIDGGLAKLLGEAA